MSTINIENLDIININNGEKNSKKDLFLQCLNRSNSLHYLEKEDIINLSHVSKSTYLFIRKNHFLIRNLLYTSTTE